jgi:starvation-inducible outer membrane lipoprotein
MKKFALLAAAALLTISACASGPVHTKNDALSAITAAEHETKRARSVGYEWRDTGKIIKKAKAALKKGDYDTAVKLANKAKRQSTHALQQYQEQKNAGPRYN